MRAAHGETDSATNKRALIGSMTLMQPTPRSLALPVMANATATDGLAKVAQVSFANNGGHMNIHSAPDELIDELDRGMMVAVPLHMIPELQSFDMTHVYRQITSRPECIQGEGE